MLTIELKEIIKDGSWVKREFYYYPDAQYFSNHIRVYFSKN